MFFTFYNAKNEYNCNQIDWKGKNGKWYNASQRNNNFINRSYELAYQRTHMTPLPVGVFIYQLINLTAEIYYHGLTWGNVSNAAVLGMSYCGEYGFAIALGWILGDWAYGIYSGETTTDVLNRYPIRW